jgi:hypothetical protein
MLHVIPVEFGRRFSHYPVQAEALTHVWAPCDILYRTVRRGLCSYPEGCWENEGSSQRTNCFANAGRASESYSWPSCLGWCFVIFSFLFFLRSARIPSGIPLTSHFFYLNRGQDFENVQFCLFRHVLTTGLTVIFLEAVKDGECGCDVWSVIYSTVSCSFVMMSPNHNLIQWSEWWAQLVTYFWISVRKMLAGMGWMWIDFMGVFKVCDQSETRESLSDRRNSSVGFEHVRWWRH